MRGIDGLRQWVIAVCAAAVICTLLRHIFPENRLGEQGRMLLPCLFLCVLLSPISSAFTGVKLPSFTAENTIDTEKITAQMQGQMQSDSQCRTVLSLLFLFGFGFFVRTTKDRLYAAKA